MLVEVLPWVGFLALVAALLAIDLGVFHRDAHEVSRREALAWSGVWIGLALIFNAGVFWLMGRPALHTGRCLRTVSPGPGGG